MRAAVALAIVLAVAPGCAWLAHAHENKLEQQVAAFEREQPDAEALGRGDTASTYRVTGWMGDWVGQIEGDAEMAPVPRQKLVDRLHAAQRRYLLAAAPLADMPDLGYAIARSVLTTGDPDALALVRRLADARVPVRQRELAKTHTYFYQPQGASMWKTTSAGMSVENGQVVDSYESKRLVERPGNCVFAGAPFGPEGTLNPALVFRLIGKHPHVYVRCYLTHRPEDLPAAEGKLVVAVKRVGRPYLKVLPRPRGWAGDRRHLDFVLDDDGDTGPLIDTDEPFASLEVDVSYEYYKDNVVVWENGAQRMRKQYAEIELAGSPVFWDRDGLPPAATGSAGSAGSAGEREATRRGDRPRAR